MNLFNTKQQPEQVPVDLDMLEQEIRSEPTAPRAYAPRETREHPQPTRLQVIAHAITTLTWSEAVKMGDAIKIKLPEGSGDLTAAIQEWAKDWETFA